MIRRIENRDYLLPAIQREIVWKREQITDLFDSVLQGYPIGTFLYWDIQEENWDESCYGRHLIPTDPETHRLEHFESFLERRSELIREELRSVLGFAENSAEQS